MLSSETLFHYPYWKVPFTIHTDASDKQLVSIISHNNKTIVIFSGVLNNTHINYTTTDKELLLIVKFLR